MKKRVISIIMACLLCLAAFTTVYADEDNAVDIITAAPAANQVKINVTIADKGNVVVPCEEVTVQDLDKDGVFTVDEALNAAHELFYDGGAKAGYSSSVTDWGLMIMKLWGDESGAFGYWNNGVSCWSLSDEVKDGDLLSAFIYSDATGYSDAFSKFEKAEYEAQPGDSVIFHVDYVQSYDENYNPVFVKCANAEIKVSDIEEPFVTDKNGDVLIKFEKEGEFKIQAVNSELNIVPAAAKVKISKDAEKCNDGIIYELNNVKLTLKTKKSKKDIKLSWTKTGETKVDAYQVFRSVKKTSGYGKKAFYTTKNGKKTSYTNTKDLKKGKKYYYKVRGMKKVDGKTYYTNWSNISWKTF